MRREMEKIREKVHTIADAALLLCFQELNGSHSKGGSGKTLVFLKNERLTIKSQALKRYFLNKVQKCILDIFGTQLEFIEP